VRQLIFPWAVLGVAATAAVGQQQAQCALRPMSPDIDLPTRGVTRVSPTNDGRCAPAGTWARMASDSLDVLVAAEGPAGSGRYWNVTIGLARPDEDSLLRGVCMVTTTLGWRTLQVDGEVSLPMPWLADRDRDGRPEVLVWNDFPLRREASPAEYGLVAWVYEFDGHQRFVFDKQLTRAVAGQIAAAYRTPSDDPFRKERRMAAARALELLASGRCTIPGAR
jgi:hypothetical protein